MKQQYPFPGGRAGRAVLWTALFLLLLLARDTLLTSCLVGFTTAQLLGMALAAVLALVFAVYNRRQLPFICRDRRLILAAVFAAGLLVPMLLKRDWQMMYFSILFCPLLAIAASFAVRWEQAAKAYVQMIAALAAYSLLCTYVLKGMAQGLPVFENASQWPFYNFGLSFVVTWPAWFRNFGIFREPGVYQFFLLLGLYLNNYAAQWDKPWKLWLCNGVLAVTMLSTFSVAGVAALGAFAVFLYWDKKYYRTRQGRWALAVAGLAVLAVLAHLAYTLMTQQFGGSIYYEFYDMFLRLTSGGESSSDRMNAVHTDLSYLLKNPIVGAPIAQVFESTAHNTSSTLILYAILGVAGGSLGLLVWVWMLWDRRRCLLGNLWLVGVMLLSFNTQNLVADVFFWLFPVLALAQRWSERPLEGHKHGQNLASPGPADPAGDCPGDQTGL